mmetsp:Transcript_44681/g.97107  ORF Transcript_44681/g.97107 Transcript_44681/m.97107 type:complete len:705 (+) Transcript_44681:86-2200(+)
MVAWEQQIADRGIPAWRDKYVTYASLKRKLDQIAVKARQKKVERGVSGELHDLSGIEEAKERFLPQAAQVENFLSMVVDELRRVSEWYNGMLIKLEHQIGELEANHAGAQDDVAFQPDTEDIAKLHAEAVELTEFAMLNSEALRKIVKKMDKQCGSNYQDTFLTKHLFESAFAEPGQSKKKPCNGERARRCRRRLEAMVSVERLQELRSKAMSSERGAGLTLKTIKPLRILVSTSVLLGTLLLAPGLLPGEFHAQRALALLCGVVALWITEAAPFEATAMLVPPLAVVLEVLDEGTRIQNANLLLRSVFNDSLYLVLCGFVISSVFSRCQLDSRAAALLQRQFGNRPFIFMLAVMFLGVFLSALVSNVTAPLVLVEVLKPLLREAPTDSRYSRALLLALAFSCNIGGMMTPISSPQNVASLQMLRLSGGHILWAQWLAVSIPFCTAAVCLAWAILLGVYHFDYSDSEKQLDESRSPEQRKLALQIPEVIFEREPVTWSKAAALIGATATLAAFACEPVAQFFGGTAPTALLFVAAALGTGTISRQTFNSYSWHLLFLIGGGNALGLCVSKSGLLRIIASAARTGLTSTPWPLAAELVLLLVAATTFISHTVASLVLMPLVVELGSAAGMRELAVMLGALACSAACALPMTSFPNVNSLMASDDSGVHWLSVRHFLVAGIPMTGGTAVLLITLGYWLSDLSIGAG